MTEEELDRKLLDKQIQCLSAMSPDDWHLIADAHNWDEPLDVLYWIVSQQSCDKATARLLFWKGEPTSHGFEDCDEEMGADSYSVEPMLNYIVRRFNTDGYQREEIEFDIFQAKTGSYGSDDKNYAAIIESGIQTDFEELRSRAKQAVDSLSSVPADLLVGHVSGRRISALVGNHQIFASYPLGVDYDTGEFIIG